MGWKAVPKRSLAVALLSEQDDSKPIFLVPSTSFRTQEVGNEGDGEAFVARLIVHRQSSRRFSTEGEGREEEGKSIHEQM